LCHSTYRRHSQHSGQKRGAKYNIIIYMGLFNKFFLFFLGGLYLTGHPRCCAAPSASEVTEEARGPRGAKLKGGILARKGRGVRRCSCRGIARPCLLWERGARHAGVPALQVAVAYTHHALGCALLGSRAPISTRLCTSCSRMRVDYYIRISLDH
jgi:hypothetical protein